MTVVTHHGFLGRFAALGAVRLLAWNDSEGLFADIRIFRVFSNRLPELTLAVTAWWPPQGEMGVSICQRTQRAYADHADGEISVILGSLNVGFFSHFQGVVHLNSKVPHRRLQLGMAK